MIRVARILAIAEPRPRTDDQSKTLAPWARAIRKAGR